MICTARQRVVPRIYGLVVGIAKQASVAIEAAQLYQQTVRQARLQHEIALARSIQESFLPDCCPYIPGWQLAIEWRAASGVGGDYYDFMPLGAQRLGLVIADVSDKGVAAALYMALTRTVMCASALSAHSPAQALYQANRLLLDDSRSGMFVSVFYAVLELESGRLTHARAGHNPPLLLRVADHALVALDPPGVLSGIVENPTLVEETTHVDPRDVLVMYADGITEATHERDEEFGEGRLQRILADVPEYEAGLLVNRIIAELRTFTGARPQSDDLALLVLRRERRL